MYDGNPRDWLPKHVPPPPDGNEPGIISLIVIGIIAAIVPLFMGFEALYYILYH